MDSIREEIKKSVIQFLFFQIFGIIDPKKKKRGRGKNTRQMN